MREKLTEIYRVMPLWDGDVANLQVTDVGPHYFIREEMIT
jgi:hypothetical protein